jgi:hypothetical protein
MTRPGKEKRAVIRSMTSGSLLTKHDAGSDRRDGLLCERVRSASRSGFAGGEDENGPVEGEELLLMRLFAIRGGGTEACLTAHPVSRRLPRRGDAVARETK